MWDSLYPPLPMPRTADVFLCNFARHLVAFITARLHRNTLSLRETWATCYASISAQPSGTSQHVARVPWMDTSDDSCERSLTTCAQWHHKFLNTRVWVIVFPICPYHSNLFTPTNQHKIDCCHVGRSRERDNYRDTYRQAGKHKRVHSSSPSCQRIMRLSMQATVSRLKCPWSEEVDLLCSTSGSTCRRPRQKNTSPCTCVYTGYPIFNRKKQLISATDWRSSPGRKGGRYVDCVRALPTVPACRSDRTRVQRKLVSSSTLSCWLREPCQLCVRTSNASCFLVLRVKYLLPLMFVRQRSGWDNYSKRGCM